jgi:ribonuclease HIII
VRFSDATFAYYKSGTLYFTETQDLSVVGIWDEIAAHSTTAFAEPTRDCLIGFDETGKGEVLGHTVLAGVMFHKDIFDELRNFGSPRWMASKR